MVWFGSSFRKWRKASECLALEPSSWTLSFSEEKLRTVVFAFLTLAAFCLSCSDVPRQYAQCAPKSQRRECRRPRPRLENSGWSNKTVALGSRWGDIFEQEGLGDPSLVRAPILLHGFPHLVCISNLFPVPPPLFDDL